MKQFIHLLLVLVLSLLLFAFPEQGLAQSETVVKVQPATQEVNQGQSFTVNVVVENVEELWAFDLSISFDPDLLSVNQVDLGDFMETAPDKSQIITNYVDNDNGSIHFMMTQLRMTDDDPEPRSGSGTLVTIHFQASSISGETLVEVLKIQDMEILTTRNGEVIDCELQPGQVTIPGEGEKDEFITYLPLVLR